MQPTIRLDNNATATLVATDAEREAVKRYLTFRAEGYQFTAAYKKGRWDGRKTLYVSTNDTFPAGLAWGVADLLAKFSGGARIEDTRVAPEPTSPDWTLRAELMPHQEAAVTRIQQRGRGVVHHPVGAGKSVVIVEAARRLRVPALVLVQRKELLHQQAEKFVELIPEMKGRLGVCGDGVFKNGPITVATIQTISARLRRIETLEETLVWLRQWRAVFIDECHHLPAASYEMLLRSLPNAYYRIGLSATPHRGGAKEQELYVTGLTGPIISSYDQTDGIEQGRLVPADVFMVDVGTFPHPVKDYMYPDEVAYGIVNNEKRNEVVARLAETFGELGPTMVLTERLEHGANLRRALLARGHEEVK